ncbi:gamma-interferon-responsive lysosomal thiol protein-like [Salvia miltiorrhiza]|uniref:gamma-interferon-responsive lysosomal thiol protein-like n=1 Tax=Salvia miltiorrhiza TaxID=226208 RepID=UPI0025AB6AB2|nr:gamma-interferon-responsive lysosomal thiol protein-like [Salvia miltiorrhiza]
MDALRFLLVLSIISSSSAAATAAGNGGEKVALELYYETLCPYCSNLIVNYLYKIFESDLISITDLKLIPYGNAKIKSNGTIVCQHGKYECILNTVEACAIDAWPDVNDHFPFIYCVESLVYHNNYTYWETCFEKLGLDATPVMDCYNGDRGTEIELRYAAQTNALEPPHTYVPWVVVDGQPLYDDYRNFKSYICEAYKGTPKPSACSKSSIGSIRKMKMDLLNSLFGQESFKSKFSRVLSAIFSWLQ